MISAISSLFVEVGIGGVNKDCNGNVVRSLSGPVDSSNDNEAGVFVL